MLLNLKEKYWSKYFCYNKILNCYHTSGHTSNDIS